MIVISQYEYVLHQVESPAPVEVAPVQKGPLPAQHAVLQTVLDSLRNSCSERAANPVSIPIFSA